MEGALSVRASAAMSSLLASHVQAPPARSDAEEIMARLDVTLEIIEKEYDEFNQKNSTRKQKKIVPALFYSFYRSELCANFVLACHAYLVQFVRSPVQAGERLDGSEPDADPNPNSAPARDGAHGHERDSNAGGRKLLALQTALQRVSECWAGVLMYRSEMNRYETITVSRTSKKSEHFLNDTYDYLFFETLYLLVEYMLEFRFLDHSRSHLYEIAPDFTAASSGSGFTTAMPSPVPSPSSAAATAAAAAAAAAAASAGGNLAAAVAAPAAPPKVKSTASAAAIAASVESNWRIVQHELQRILRSRNFNFSMRKRAPSSNPHLVRGNGLNHIPLASSTLQGSGGGPGVQARRPVVSQSLGKHGASYRSPATFRLDGAPRSWDDDPADTPFEDDSRALSHLPGQFKTRGSFGILDCLDLRSPMIASMLPNPRTMRSANEAYVFGAEARRASSSRNSSRLTHAEAKYLRAHRALQAQRALEWKLRLEREEREERAKEEEQGHEEEARRARTALPRLEEEKTEVAIATMPVTSEGTAVDAAATAAAASVATAASVAAAHTVAAVAAAPVPPLQLQPRPPTYPPRPTPPHHHSAGADSAAAVAADAFPFPLQPSPPVTGSASARSRPLRPASQPLSSSSAYPAGSLTARASGRLQPIAAYGAAPAAVSAAPSPRTRLTLDEALNSTKPLIQINGNRISLVDFQI